MFNIEHKTITFAVKAVDDERGLIEAYGSVFNYADFGDDVVLPGAFKRTIQNSKSKVEAGKAKFLAVMLYQHDEKLPIGGWYELEEDNHGLKCKGQIVLSTQLGRETYELIKAGVINQFSIGYDIPSGGAKYDKDSGYRHLKELRLWEISPVTFAMNDEALLTGVKSASGSTSWALADESTAWDGSRAHKEILAWAKKSDGTLDPSKMKSVHFWYDPDKSTEATGYKMPFCYIESGTPKAVPRAIIACAAVLDGGRGGADLGGDTEAVKSKVASYYKKMGQTPPWEDTSKSHDFTRESKEFYDHFRQEAVEVWLYDKFQAITRALRSAIIDAFLIGDHPEDDLVSTILNDQDGKKGLITVLEEYVKHGVDLDASAYLQETLEAHGPNGYPASYYMRSNRTLDIKAGRAISAENAAKVAAHVQAMHDMADKALDISKMHHKAMQEHVKAMHDAADDLATQLQGSEAAYGTDKGTPQDGQGEGKAAPQHATGATLPPHASTVEEQELTEALTRLRSLRTKL